MFSLRRHSREAPTGGLVEFLGPGSRLGGEPETLDAPRSQPIGHRVVQHAPIPASFVIRIDEQCPDVAVRGIADCKGEDRKSTRLNSSHSQISYAVFCLKKKKKKKI